jgi:ribokinase
MKPIVTVGSINMDLVSSAERIPRPGETLIGRTFHANSGGKGANQAVAVARLGYPSVMLGMVGEDALGEQLLQTLKRYGVDTSQIEVASGSSGTASIVVDAEGENAIIVTPGANSWVTPSYLETKREVLSSASLVLTQLEVPLQTVSWLAECCAQLNIPLILDPAPATVLPQRLLTQVTWFTPNQTEAAFYVNGELSEEETLASLFSMGLRQVVLKRGAEGVLIACDDGRRERIRAVPVQTVDTTAAGDAFNGAFGVALMRGKTMVESAQFAAAAAALSVTRAGAQTSLASQEEVDAVLLRSPNVVSLHSE